MPPLPLLIEFLEQRYERTIWKGYHKPKKDQDFFSKIGKYLLLKAN